MCPGKPSGRMSDIHSNKPPPGLGAWPSGCRNGGGKRFIDNLLCGGTVPDNYYQARQAFPFSALLIRRMVHRKIRNHVCEKCTERNL